VTESASSLESDIIDAVDKIEAVIEIFLCLSDVSDTENLPSFTTFFSSKAAQRKTKLHLIKCLIDI
jgi:hypothetical protein